MQPTIALILMLAIYNNVGRFTLFGGLVHFNLQFFGLETSDVNLVMHRTLFIERQLCCMVSNLKKTTIFLVFRIKNESLKNLKTVKMTVEEMVHCTVHSLHFSVHFVPHVVREKISFEH